MSQHEVDFYFDFGKDELLALEVDLTRGE